MVNEQRIMVNKQPAYVNYAVVWTERHGYY